MDEIELLKNKLIFLNDLKGFLDDYNEYISKEYNYVKDSWNWMNSYPEFFLQSDIYSMQEFYDNIISTTELSLLMDSENRRILKGQFQQYKIKYMRLYYLKHTKTIGDSVNWDMLENITKSREMQRIRDMKSIKGIIP